MAWTKSKTAVVVGVAALLAAVITVTVIKVLHPPDYSWEVESPKGSSFGKARPQVTIVPTKFRSKGGWNMIWSRDGKAIGINVAPREIIQCAFRTLEATRTKVDGTLPQGRFDFFCNLPKGASNALCKAVMAKFGVTASHQMIETNVFVLSVRNANAGGLKPPVKAHDGGPDPVSDKPGHYSNTAASMKSLAKWIERRVHVPVLDRTGLTDDFSLSLDWDEPDAQHRNLEGLKTALINQLGLELTADIQPVKMLVIEKAR